MNNRIKNKKELGNIDSVFLSKIIICSDNDDLK